MLELTCWCERRQDHYCFIRQHHIATQSNLDSPKTSPLSMQSQRMKCQSP